LPTIRSVSFVSRAVACDLSPGPRQAVISITEPGSGPAPLRPGWAAILRLSFHDVDRNVEGYDPFSEEMAQVVLEWLDAVEDEVDAVVVHCVAGISRSAAVARFIAERYAIADFPREYDRYNPLVLALLARRWMARRALHANT
jgi:predicted protein tyrosine phosphatase